MTAKEISNGLLRTIACLVAIALLCLVLYQVRTLILYLILATIVAFIGGPISVFLKKKLRFSDLGAAIAVLLLFMSISLGSAIIFVPLLISQGKNIAKIDFQGIGQNIHHFLAQQLSRWEIDTLALETQNMFQLFDLQNISLLINHIISFIGSFGMGMFSVLFISFFFLKDGNSINKLIIKCAAPKHLKKIKNAMRSTKLLLSRYFIGLSIQLSIIFFLTTINLLIFNVKDAIIIAFLCSLLNLIPYLGPIIGSGIITLLTLSNFIEADFVSQGLPTTLYVLIGYLIIQLIDNTFSQPIIFSNSVKSNPLEIFFITLAGGMLFGLIGMVFIIPSYTVVKVILKSFFPENKFIKILTQNIGKN